MFIEICSVLGLTMWGVGLSLIAFVFFSKTNDSEDKFGLFLLSFIFFGCIGLALCLPGIITPIKNTVTTYETPTSIIKTNNVTLVNHIVGNELVIGGKLFLQANYWNSTNIMIKVDNGENFYGIKVSPAYEVILR